MLRNILFAHDGRLRPTWRGVLFIIVSFVALAVAFAVGEAVDHAASRYGVPVTAGYASEMFAFLAANAFLLRVVDRHGWDYAWLHRSALRPSKLATGAALGALAPGIPAATLLVAGQLRLIDSPDGSWWASAWLAACVLLPAAFAEELFSRGYLFATIREAAGWRWALGTTSVAFGLLHMWNPGATWQSLSVVVVAGVFLGAIVLVTGSLYAATAAHFVWNWVMAAVLHVPVSGLAVGGFPDYRIIETGPDWLTGGGWGPEGGVAAGAGLGLGLVYLVWLQRKRSPLTEVAHE